MEKVTQVLIMAGGFGTRMSHSLNPLQCKSLIKLNGQSLIGHLLDNLKEGGIKKFLIATNTHSHNEIISIVENKKIENATVIVANGETVVGNPEFGGVPYELKDYLDERFLMVCGHHIITTKHINKMLISSKEYENIFTAYSNKLYTMDKMKRIIYKNGNFEYIDIDQGNFNKDHLYVRNPYILKKEIIESIHKNNYAETFSYYIFKTWKEKKYSLGVVIAEMPPEFDYDSEFKKTKKFFKLN
jgi:choline kinase